MKRVLSLSIQAAFYGLEVPKVEQHIPPYFMEWTYEYRKKQRDRPAVFTVMVNGKPAQEYPVRLKPPKNYIPSQVSAHIEFPAISAC